VVNLVCDRALLAGYVAGAREIDAAMVRRAATEVLAARPAHPRRRQAAVAAGVAVLAFVPVAVWRALPARASRETVPVPATAAPSPSPSPEGGPLVPIVLALPHDASLQESIARIQALWGPPALQRTPLRTYLDQVRRLDLPVVMEMFHPARADTCYIALLRIDGDHALVATGTGPALRVPLAQLDRLWTRQAVFLWRDFDALSTTGDAERTEAWARDRLARLGYLRDADLAGAIMLFQRDADLTADGRIGARTLMSLYSRGPNPRPRLGGAS
jgi:general secretion pathway protein A